MSSSWGFDGPVSAALGNSGRAAVIPGEMTLNPASTAFVQGYHATISYRDYAFDPTGKEINLRASMIDSHPENLFPAAFTFAKNNDDQDFHIGIAKSLLPTLSLGLELERYISDPSVGPKNIENDFSLGLLWAVTPNWGVALVTENLIRTDIAELDQAISIATSYNYVNVLRLQLDLTYPTQNNDDDDTILMTGIESHFIPNFPVRLGYRQNNLTNTTFWTAGTGWVGPKIAIDYAFEKDVKSNKEQAHSVDLRIYF